MIRTVPRPEYTAFRPRTKAKTAYSAMHALLLEWRSLWSLRWELQRRRRPWQSHDDESQMAWPVLMIGHPIIFTTAPGLCDELSTEENTAPISLQASAYASSFSPALSDAVVFTATRVDQLLLHPCRYRYALQGIAPWWQGQTCTRYCRLVLHPSGTHASHSPGWQAFRVTQLLNPARRFLKQPPKPRYVQPTSRWPSFTTRTCKGTLLID